MAQPAFRYWAFISYSHQDRAWGDWLHRKLETYRVPRRLVGQPHWSGKIPARLFPIFRDRDELPSSADLGSVLNEALRQSRCQIVICSPRAAQSRWVNEEIKFFKAHGREHRLLAFIIDGEPRVGSDRECFPPALRFKSDARGELTDERTEIVAADARDGRDGREGALLKLIAGILGVSYDDLKQRERRRQFWRRAQYVAVAIATLAAVLGSWRWFEHYKEAQARDAHIEKVYDLGRRELLEHHEARAAVYLNEAYRLGRDTPALRFMLGQAMQAIEPLEDLDIDTGGPVRRPAFAPDSQSFITPTQLPSGDTVAQIWETATGKQLAVLKGLPNAPLVTRFLPGGKRVLVSGFMEEQLEETRGTGAFTGVWDATTGEQRMRFDGHTGRFGQPIDAAGRWLVTADSTDAKGARLWDLATGKLAHTFEAPTRVLAASVSPDGTLAAVGDRAGNTLLYEVANGRPAQRLPGHMTSHVVGLMFTPDGRRVLAFGARGDVRIWEIDSGELQLAFAGDTAGFNDVLLSPDGKRLVTVGTEAYRVWDLERGILQLAVGDNLTNWSSGALTSDGNVLITADVNQSFANLFFLPGRSPLLGFERNGELDSVATSPDGRRLLIASGRGRVQLARLPIGALQRFSHEPRDGRYSSVYATRFDPSEKHVITASYDGTLRAWSIGDGSQRVVQSGSALVDAAYSPDGLRLASLDVDGRLRLFDAATLEMISQVVLAPAWTSDPLVFSSDSRKLTTLPDGTSPATTRLQLWNPADGTAIGAIELPCKPISAVFLASSDRLAAGCDDGAGRIWNAEPNTPHVALTGAHTRLRKLASRGDDLVAGLAERDPQVHLWRAADGSAIESLTLPPPQFPVALAFAPGRDLLAVGSSSGAVLTYDLRTRQLRTLGAHTKDVHGLKFLDSGLLVSFRSDSSIKLWDVDRGELLQELMLHEWLAWSVAADRKGARLLSGGLDGAATLWDLHPESRSAGEIATLLQCHAPWRLAGDGLVPEGAPTARCGKG